MFKTFRWKLTGSYFLLIVLLLIIAGGLVFSSFKSYYLQNLELRLTREAYLIADMAKYLGPDTTDRYQDLCATASRDSATRVSIIDQKGIVLGDSEFDSRQMDIHKSRPEVYQALHGKVGVAMRYSTTEKIKMLYVAVPFRNQAQSGVVRMALPLADLAAINTRILIIMLLALLVAAFLATILSLLMARKFSGPLDEITMVVKDMAGGNLKRRINYQSGDELGILAQAFNNMAESIEQGVSDWSAGLYCACKGGHRDLVLLMIEKGANNWNDGLTPACYSGYKDIVLLLIEKGANNWSISSFTAAASCGEGPRSSGSLSASRGTCRPRSRFSRCQYFPKLRTLFSAMVTNRGHKLSSGPSVTLRPPICEKKLRRTD